MLTGLVWTPGSHLLPPCADIGPSHACVAPGKCQPDCLTDLPWQSVHKVCWAPKDLTLCNFKGIIQLCITDFMSCLIPTCCQSGVYVIHREKHNTSHSTLFIPSFLLGCNSSPPSPCLGLNIESVSINLSLFLSCLPPSPFSVSFFCSLPALTADEETGGRHAQEH